MQKLGSLFVGKGKLIAQTHLSPKSIISFISSISLYNLIGKPITLKNRNRFSDPVSFFFFLLKERKKKNNLTSKKQPNTVIQPHSTVKVDEERLFT